MARLKDQAWNLPEGTRQADGSRTHEWDSIHAALLLDLRDQAQEQTRLQRDALHLQREQLNVLKRMDRRMQQVAKLPAGRVPR